MLLHFYYALVREFVRALSLYLIADSRILGVYCFTRADATSSPSFEIFGVAMLSLSTTADAFRLNLSESLMTSDTSGRSRRTAAPRSVYELLYYSEMIGCILVMPVVLLSGELLRARDYFAEHSGALPLLLVMGALAFAGALAMMAFVQQTSAYALSLVGIVRMLCSISLSVVLYAKPLTRDHVLGALLCAAGLTLRAHLGRNKATSGKERRV